MYYANNVERLTAKAKISRANNSVKIKATQALDKDWTDMIDEIAAYSRGYRQEQLIRFEAMLGVGAEIN